MNIENISNNNMKKRTITLYVGSFDRIPTEFLKKFSEYCKTTGTSVKGFSYDKAIQYLAEYLNINLDFVELNDVKLIIDTINTLKTDNHSTLYADFEQKLTGQNRDSYLKSGLIFSALQPFMDFCKLNGLL